MATTTSSKVAVVKGEGDLPERFICPVCFRLPEKEVFQCRDGHVLCSECYNKKTKCPKCGGSLVKHQPIRNRFFEAELEQFAKVDCSFKSIGCAEKVRKDLLEQHQHSCYFNYEKFGFPFSLCKAMNLNCNFYFNQSNLNEFVDHFISAHGAEMLKSMEGMMFGMKLYNFLGGSVLEQNSAASEEHEYAFEFFTPIVANLEEEECYILTIPMLNTSLDLFQIVSYYLPCFNSEKTLVNPIKMEYSVSREAVAEPTGSAWTFVAVLIDNPINLLETKDACLTTARSSCLQTSQLKSYIYPGNCLIVDCKIILEGNENAIKNNINLVPPQVFFCCRKISQSLIKTEAKTEKVKRLRDFKGDSRSAIYLGQFQKALLISTPDAQKRVFEIIDLIVDSVVHKERGYLPWIFGPDNFERILYKAMFMVVQYGSVEALKRMMGKDGNGLDWGVVGNTGFTLLQLTMLDANLDRGLEKAQLLLNKIDMKALDDNGRSLVHYAARYGNDQALTFVCQLGLAINADKNGDTPLHLAMNNRQLVNITVKKVEILLKHGADMDSTNGEGKTPLDVAKSHWRNVLWMGSGSQGSFIII